MEDEDETRTRILTTLIESIQDRGNFVWNPQKNCPTTRFDLCEIGPKK